MTDYKISTFKAYFLFTTAILFNTLIAFKVFYSCKNLGDSYKKNAPKFNRAIGTRKTYKTRFLQ